MDKIHHRTLCIAFYSGLFSLLFLSILVSGGFSLPQKNDVGGWFYEYQATLGALVALVTVLVINHHYRDTLYRRRLAERAKMNDALSDLCSYARQCFQIIKDDGQAVPNRSTDAINILKNSIEFLDHDTSESVFELVSFYQVYNARLERYFDQESIRSINAKDEMIYDSIKLYAFASGLFDYARKEVEVQKKPEKLSQNEIYSGLNGIYGHTRPLMAHNDPILEKVLQFIEERHE